MDETSIILLMQFVASLLLALFGFLSWRSSIKNERSLANNTIHSALLDMHKFYASETMRDALEKLCDFYREKCKGSLGAPQPLEEIEKENTMKKLKSKFKQILDEKIKDEFEVKKNRRIVSHFYLHMADLYFNDILGDHNKYETKKLFFNYWTAQTILILPKIINPLEDTLAEHYHQKLDVVGRKRLEALYKESYDFFLKEPEERKNE